MKMPENNLKAKPSQAKPSQAKPSQAKPSQAKPSQAKPSQAKPSQAKPSQATSASGNLTLSKAKKAKQDEFYTQLTDISNELKHYKSQLRGKTILCNCDDPFESNFFKYFALNFNTLGLKKLIATSFNGSPIVGGHLPLLAIEGLKPDGKDPYAIEINAIPDQNGDGATDITDVEYLLKHDTNTAKSLKCDENYNGGDFRSHDCVELLKQADIVITNPPFSLFREFMTQLITHDKKFLIIGNQNAITYKEVFKLIKENKLWLGVDNGGTKWFRVPNDYDIQTESRKKIENGIKYFSMGSIMWFTNMDNPKRHEEIPLYKKYTPDEYPKYDNYDSIDVGKVVEIPADYSGVMGVPITFLNKHNPKQFEIFGHVGSVGADGVYSFANAIYINGAKKFKRILIKRKS